MALKVRDPPRGELPSDARLALSYPLGPLTGHPTGRVTLFCGRWERGEAGRREKRG